MTDPQTVPAAAGALDALNLIAATRPTKLTVAQVCALVPGKCGGTVHKATINRWINPGYPLRDGTRVRLPATRAGSRWLIDPNDLDAFFAALADAAGKPNAAATPTRTAAKRTAAKRTDAKRTDADRTAAAQLAAAQLAARGA
jgi:hypothetical protein